MKPVEQTTSASSAAVAVPQRRLFLAPHVARGEPDAIAEESHDAGTRSEVLFKTSQPQGQRSSTTIAGDETLDMRRNQSGPAEQSEGAATKQTSKKADKERGGSLMKDAAEKVLLEVGL